MIAVEGIGNEAVWAYLNVDIVNIFASRAKRKTANLVTADSLTKKTLDSFLLGFFIACLLPVM
jgi:hypothetical protein